METDAHKLVGRYQDNAKMQAQAAQASRNDLAQQAWTTLDQNLQALKRMLVLPGPEHQAAAQPSHMTEPAMQGEQDDGDSGIT